MGKVSRLINPGKGFEDLIKDSCLVLGVDCNRLKDAGYRGETTERRFTSRNICDFIIFDGETLLYAEAKTSKDNSIAFKRLTQQKNLFKKYNSNKTSNVKFGYILEFRKSNKYFWVSVFAVDCLQEWIDKKSFNVNDLEEYEGVGEVKRINTYLPHRKRKERLDMSFMSVI